MTLRRLVVPAALVAFAVALIPNRKFGQPRFLATTSSSMAIPVFVFTSGKWLRDPVLRADLSCCCMVPAFPVWLPSTCLSLGDHSRVTSPFSGSTYTSWTSADIVSRSRPKEMDEPPEAHSPLVRSNEAAHDISAVVDIIRKRRHVDRVALFGWATGGQWAGYYASICPEEVGALILLNSLYRGNAQQSLIGRGSDLEDPAHPGRFNQASCAAYRLNDAGSLLRPWDHTIPLEDKDAWRDPALSKAYVDAALASDPTAQSRNPPSFRSPCGALEDSVYLATGRQLWDASLITAPTLVLASEKDFWSRTKDRENLRADLVHFPNVQIVVISGATHFVLLDRPDRGREVMLNAIKAFLK